MTMSKDGTILVTTLWILAILTILALGIGIRMAVDIKLVGFFLDSAKARYIAEAGLRKTMALIQNDGTTNVDSYNELWACGYDFDEEAYVLKDMALGEGAFTVRQAAGKDDTGADIFLYGASDEEARININKADAELLGKLPNFTPEILAAVLDWRDEDNLERLDGAEDSYYEGLDAPYECKDADFSTPEELKLVKGVTDEAYDSVKDIITVYGDSKGININTASENVLAALIGPTFPDTPKTIIKYRNGSDGIPGTQDDRVFTDVATIVAQLSDPVAGGLDQLERDYLGTLIHNKKYFKVSSKTFRIKSTANLKGGRVKKTIEAVVTRAEEPMRILYYHEE